MKKNYLLIIVLLTSTLSFGQLSNSEPRNGYNQIDGFAVYPNPITNGSFRISFTQGTTKELKVYDMLGKLVLAKNVRRNELIKVDKLNPGIYILRVEEDGKKATRKLVIE